MKKVIYCTLAALVLSAVPTAAQTTQKHYRISGVLCDSARHEAEPFATIRLLQKAQKQPAGKVLRVATTTANGRFEITAPAAGSYTLEAIVLGKEPVRREVTLSDERRTLKLDTLYIKEYSNTLGAATVTVQRPLVKAEIDKLTYSMADDPEAQTNTTLEMLRKVPMVTVDGEDKIQVNGSSNFVIYVNGKPNKMMSSNPSTILKSYPASVIKKIEVITNPGAKYDAEGVGGVLNIVTEGDTKMSGYTVTPNLSVSNRGVSGNLFGMVQLGKLTLSAYYGSGWMKNRKPITQKGEREVFADEVNHLLRNESTIDNKGVFQYGNLDASYEFTDKDLLSVSAGVHGWKGKNNSDSYSDMYNANGDRTYGYKQFTRTRSLYLGTNLSTDYQHTFKEDCHLTFSYRYNLSPSYEKNDRYYSDLENVPEEYGLLDSKTDPDNRSYEHAAQVDFTTPIAKNHTLSTGLKYIYRINRSDNEELTRAAGTDAEFVRNEDRSLLYRHRGDIGAVYAEYTYKFKNLSLMAGSRYEYYRVKVSYPDGKRPSFSTHFNDWVPSLSVGYNLKPSMMLKAGYNLRIGRPDITYLSPYVQQTSPEAISYGNPDMGSTKAHNLNLSYSMFGPKLNINLSLTHTFSNDEVTQYSFVNEGVMNTTYGNFLHSRSTNLSGYVNWTIVQGTVFSTNLNGGYSDFKSDVTGEHNSGFSMFMFGSLRQDLPWKLKLQLHGGGSNGRVSLQGKMKGFYFYGITLSRSFLEEDRLRLTFGAGNFINRYMKFRNETITDQFRQYSVTRNDNMHISFGISYRLGKLNAMVKKVGRSIQNDDTMSNSGGQGGQGGSQGGGQGGM